MSRLRSVDSSWLRAARDPGRLRRTPPANGRRGGLFPLLQLETAPGFIGEIRSRLRMTIRASIDAWLL